MRLDKRPVLALMTAGSVVLAACRTSSPAAGDSAGDSVTAPARADSTPSTGTASATVRSDSVLLRTDKAQYKAGEEMTLAFENKSASSYAFNPCTRSIEREEGGGWTAVADADRVCTMEAWILDPRGTRTGKTELPATLAAGRYRVVVRMTVEAPGDTQAAAITA
jgi:hypothetical protein